MKNTKLLLKVFITSILLIVSLCEEDYYKILGVSRSADAKEIRRAFKKLSLKWHPDKNKQSPEYAKKMFIKIANAYEVLSDPKKKQIYDTQGARAVNDHVSMENSGQGNFGDFGGFGNFGNFGNGGGFGGGGFDDRTFDDIFSNFFGHGDSGHGRKKSKGKKGQKEQKRSIFDFDDDDDDVFQTGHFTHEDIITLNINTLSDIMNRREIWFVLFYKENDRNINELSSMWNTLSEKSSGIFKISTANCSSDPDICEEYHIAKTPLILYFPDSREEEQVYKGVKTWEQIFKFGNEKMQSFVRIINNDNLENFIVENSNEVKVILFTQRKTTSPLLKALSKFYKGKLNFGEIRETEKALVKKFQADRFPSILVLTDNENLRGVFYDGPLKRTELDAFLKEYAYPINRPPKKGDVKELDKLLFTSSQMCNEKDSMVCFISLVNKKPNLNLLTEIAQEFRKDPINFYYVVLEKYKNFYSSFEQEDHGAEFILLKGKRKKYIAIKKLNNKQDLYKLIENVINGGGNFKKLRKGLNFVVARSDL